MWTNMAESWNQAVVRPKYANSRAMLVALVIIAEVHVRRPILLIYWTMRGLFGLVGRRLMFWAESRTSVCRKGHLQHATESCRGVAHHR